MTASKLLLSFLFLKKLKLTSSFTLIEILVVIAIIGVLSAAVLVAVNPVKRAGKARDAQRKSDMSQVKTALEVYFVTNGQYPFTGNDPYLFESWWGDYPYLGINGNRPYSGPTAYIPNLAPDYIKRLPKDPRGIAGNPGTEAPPPYCIPDNVGYTYVSNGADYKLKLNCAPENYDIDDKSFIDPVSDGDGDCNTQLTGPGGQWAWAIWSSDTSKCWTP